MSNNLKQPKRRSSRAAADVKSIPGIALGNNEISCCVIPFGRDTIFLRFGECDAYLVYEAAKAADVND